MKKLENGNYEFTPDELRAIKQAIITAHYVYVKRRLPHLDGPAYELLAEIRKKGA